MGSDGREVKLGDRTVYCFDPNPEWSTAERFPKDELTETLG